MTESRGGDGAGPSAAICGRTMFDCVDRDQEALPGSGGNEDGALFYHVKAACGTGLPCPPYNNHQTV